jgi:2-oxoglutarate ferredoxin oxidoreductase subunit beta
MIDPKKLERTLVKALEHKGFSYLEVFSNCHVNLGRKNKMASATANLEWIDSISLAKTKFDMLEEKKKRKISNWCFKT